MDRAKASERRFQKMEASRVGIRSEPDPALLAATLSHKGRGKESPRRDIADRRHRRREIVLQHFVGVTGGLVAARGRLVIPAQKSRGRDL